MLLLMLVALVFLVLAAFNVLPVWRISWGWLGMAFWALSILLPALLAFARQGVPGQG